LRQVESSRNHLFIEKMSKVVPKMVLVMMFCSLSPLWNYIIFGYVHRKIWTLKMYIVAHK